MLFKYIFVTFTLGNTLGRVTVIIIASCLIIVERITGQYNLKEDEESIRKRNFNEYSERVIQDMTSLEETFGEKLLCSDETLEFDSDDEIGELSLSLWNNLGKVAEYAKEDRVREEIDDVVTSLFVFGDELEQFDLKEEKVNGNNKPYKFRPIASLKETIGCVERHNTMDVLSGKRKSRRPKIKDSTDSCPRNAEKENKEGITLEKSKRKKKHVPKSVQKERRRILPKKHYDNPQLAERIRFRMLPHHTKTEIDDVD